MIRHFAVLCWNTVAALAACLSLPGSCELLMLSAAALIPRQRKLAAAGPLVWRTAVVIPAHNERVTIVGCVQSFLRSATPSPGTEVGIFVIADNCTDDTARLAVEAGAQVLERHNSVERGKGYALHYAFSRLLGLGYDCVIIVDADTQVAPGFLASASDALRGGEQAIQARYLVQNARQTIRSRLMSVALRAFNVVRPLGREHLGLSCGIGGNGFGLRSDTLRAAPYLAASIVEDLEYHIELVRSGRRVAFLNHATVYAETPVQANAVKTQRARWEGGRLRMLFTQAPALLRDLASGRLRCLEPLMELLLLPLAFHVTLVAIALTAPLPFARDLGLAGALIVLLHLLAAITVGGGSWRDAAILAVAPFYILWKLMLIPTLIRSSHWKEDWVRTARNAEQQDREDTQPAVESSRKH